MVTSSGKKGASAVIHAKPCFLLGFMFVGDTANEPTLTIYDNATEGSGTELAFSMVSDECHTNFVWFGEKIPCSAGIYGKLSAEAGDYVIYYEI